jgi:large subunit ribosomal protein L6
MSRIGRQLVLLPTGVTVVLGPTIRVSGPKGTLTLPTHPLVTLEVRDHAVSLGRVNDSARARSLHGLYRSLVANHVTGVSTGYERRLELKGVGYRATIQGQSLVLSLGYSHPITVEPPAGIEFTVEKSTVTVRGSDKALVGQIAATIRRFRPPEPYKGKGIRYSDEIVRRKAGKAAKAAGK